MYCVCDMCLFQGMPVLNLLSKTLHPPLLSMLLVTGRSISHTNKLWSFSPLYSLFAPSSLHVSLYSPDSSNLNPLLKYISCLYLVLMKTLVEDFFLNKNIWHFCILILMVQGRRGFIKKYCFFKCATFLSIFEMCSCLRLMFEESGIRAIFLTSIST